MIRLALRCQAAEADSVLAELLEVAPSGIEEVSAPDGHRDLVEYAVYGAPGELPDVGAVRAATGGSAVVEVRTKGVPDDWSERCKRFYYPVLVGGRIYVRPPWERPAERGGVIEVVIDPGRAFGTGTHPTTRMCLELLLEAADAGRRPPLSLRRRRARSLCDLGCGSGVLAIAGAMLGFRPVLGVDTDQAAVEESARNARSNFVEIELRRVDLKKSSPPPADVVTANLTAGLLAEVAAGWSGGRSAPGTAIVSGFLTEEADAAASSLAAAGLREKRRLRDGEWSALLADAAR